MDKGFKAPANMRLLAFLSNLVAAGLWWPGSVGEPDCERCAQPSDGEMVESISEPMTAGEIFSTTF